MAGPIDAKLYIVAEERPIMDALKRISVAILRLAAPLLSDRSIDRLISFLARVTVRLGLRIKTELR